LKEQVVCLFISLPLAPPLFIFTPGSVALSGVLIKINWVLHKGS